MTGTKGKADNIITSNGGIIPIEFEREYPFLTYNAPSANDPTADAIYVAVMTRRLNEFLKAFKYKAVVAAYLPGKRNRRAVARACAENGIRLEMLLTPIQWLHMTQKVPTKGLGKKTELYKTVGAMRTPMSFPEISGWIRQAIDRVSA